MSEGDNFKRCGTDSTLEEDVEKYGEDTSRNTNEIDTLTSTFSSPQSLVSHIADHDDSQDHESTILQYPPDVAASKYSTTLVGCTGAQIGPVLNRHEGDHIDISYNGDHLQNCTVVKHAPLTTVLEQLGIGARPHSGDHYDHCTIVQQTLPPDIKPTAEQITVSQGAASQRTIQAESYVFSEGCKKKTRDFVETTFYRNVKREIEDNNMVLVIGGSGDGKSSILQYISAKPMYGYLPISRKGAKEIQKCIRLVQGTGIQILFVIDDPFGGSYTQHQLVDKWASLAEDLEIYLVQNVHKFLFATRTTVWADCKDLLGQFELFRNVVEVTSSNLSDADKKKLVLKHLKDRSAKLTNTNLDQIVYEIKPLAFCQCCKLMSDAVEKYDVSGKEIIEIFRRPHSFIQSQLNKMAIQEKLKFASLCLIMLCGGKLKCKELTGTLSYTKPEVRKRIEAVRDACDCINLTCGGLQICVEKLIGTFLEKEQDTGADSNTSDMYTFIHDSIHEAVIMKYGKDHFGHCLEFLNHDVIVKIVRPQSYAMSEISVCSDFMLSVATHNYPELVEVFTEKTIGGGWGMRDVFQNPCVLDERFQYSWCEYLKTWPDKLTAFSQSKPWLGLCVWHLAGASGAFTLCKLLDAQGVTCNCHADSSVLCQAASRDETATVRDLLQSLKPTADQIAQALISACESGGVNVLELLIPQQNSDRCDATMKIGFEQACLNGRHGVVKFLLENYYTPCGKDKCVCCKGLLYASGGGQTDIVNLLLFHGANINTRSIDGRTCLHWAAYQGNTDTVKFLVKNGADISATDYQLGMTCLHLATFCGDTETVRYLVTQGADTNSTDRNGETCLHWATNKDNPETVCCLVNHGVNINMKDSNGETCLLWAARRGQVETVSYLVSQGAEVSIRNTANQSPLDVAKDQGYTQIISVLTEQRYDNSRELSEDISNVGTSLKF